MINAYYLASISVETFNKQTNDVGGNRKSSIGPVSAMAINKSNEKIVFFVAKNSLYIIIKYTKSRSIKF